MKLNSARARKLALKKRRQMCGYYGLSQVVETDNALQIERDSEPTQDIYSRFNNALYKCDHLMNLLSRFFIDHGGTIKLREIYKGHE